MIPSVSPEEDAVTKGSDSIPSGVTVVCLKEANRLGRNGLQSRRLHAVTEALSERKHFIPAKASKVLDKHKLILYNTV